MSVRPRGRTPRWCSDACRHRAWEQRRAAASGRSAIEITERVVEIHVPVPTPVEVPTLPAGVAWVPALKELAHQLDIGRIYFRDLPAVADALRAVINAYDRRVSHHRR